MPPTAADHVLDAIYAQVLAEPGCDLHRLAWADRFEELYGAPSPRAEFVRVQCKLSRLLAGDEEPGDDTRDEIDASWERRGDHIAALRRRERELLFDDIGRTAKWFDRPGMYLLRGPAGDGESLVFCSQERPGDGRQVFEMRVRRGWPSAVTLPLAAWVGGPCGNCDSGLVLPVAGVECHLCGGKGEFPALGPLIAASCPLWPEETAVRLSDLEPIRLVCDFGEVWNWAPGRPEPESPWFITQALFDLIDLPLAEVGGERMAMKCAVTAKDAQEALSKATLAWAKSQIRI
jgi:uncharacterized protein (TIGR02996 family)